MSIARHYRMQAAAGQGEAVLAALQGLAAALQAIPGFIGADLLRDLDDPDQFVFIEKWASVEAHKAGGPSLPKPVFAGLMAALAGKPQGAYLEYLPQG
jgi:quinol monooxygenase YgiN